MITRMPQVVVGAAAAGGAALLIGIGGVLAFSAGSRGQTPVAAASSPVAGKAQAYCDNFVGHLAKDLGKRDADVRNAIKKAANETLDDAAKAGDLTKDQADRLRNQLGSESLCSGRLAGLGRRRGGEGLSKGAYRDAAAKALGISSNQLQDDLRKGQTLHQIADSRGISESQFRTALIRNLTPTIDQAVKDGKLTKDQEARVLQSLQNSPLPLWDRANKGRLRLRPSPSPST